MYLLATWRFTATMIITICLISLWEFVFKDFLFPVATPESIWHHMEYVVTVSLFAAIAQIFLLLFPINAEKELAKSYKSLQESEHRYRALYNNANDMIITIDLHGKIITANKTTERILGYQESELSQMTIADLLSPNELKKARAMIQQKLSNHDKTVYDLNLTTKNKKVIQCEVSSNLIYDHERSIGVQAFIRNISARKKAEKRNKLAAKVFETAAEGVVVTNASGIMEYVNPAFNHITGYSPEEAIGKHSNFLNSGKHEEEFFREMWLNLKETGRWQGEVWNRNKNCELFLVRQTITAIKDDDGDTVQYASVFHDITDIRAGEEQIKYQAFHDVMTGLPNRTLFMDRLKQSIARAKRDNKKMALLFIDIDDFKLVNDSHGHTAGDLLIQGIAMRIMSSVRESDTAARFAGDEFVVIMENIHNENDADLMSRKIIESISEPFVYHEKKILATVSIGVSLYPEDGQTQEEILRNADLAMYNVKDQSKNNYSFFTKSLNDEATKRNELAYRMREAVERNEFEVYYQPKVDLPTGLICGMEALVRWRSDGHLVLPDAFIPVAEETGLITSIGEFVLLAACSQLKVWQDKFNRPVTIAVNVSALQLDEEDFPKLVRTVLETTRLSPESLCLEVTESALIKDTKTALNTLHELKELGIKISMDDFGTGYSSLSNLREFPITELKIDRMFVNTITQNKEDAAISNTIISMAHNLDMNVVAEGVENSDQLSFLRVAGCDEVQGYLFSRPLPRAAMEEELSLNKTYD